MRYNIPEEEFDKIKKGASFDDVAPEFDGVSYKIYKPKRLKHIMFGLDRIAKVLGASSFADWVSPFTEYPFRLYALISDYVPDSYKAPVAIDFKTQLDQKLQKKLLPKFKGMPTSVEYYKTKRILKDNAGNIVTDFLDQNLYEYIDLIARIDFDFSFLLFTFRASGICRRYFETC